MWLGIYLEVTSTKWQSHNLSKWKFRLCVSSIKNSNMLFIRRTMSGFYLNNKVGGFKYVLSVVVSFKFILFPQLLFIALKYPPNRYLHQMVQMVTVWNAAVDVLRLKDWIWPSVQMYCKFFRWMIQCVISLNIYFYYIIH